VRVLATRRLPGEAWDDLGDVEVGPLDSTRDDVEILIVANETVDLDRLPSLRLVANYGVTNTPGVLDAATADLALALMLAARRRVVEGDALVRAGGWEAPSWSAGPFLGRELTGATLGIVGLGRIGSAVARRAAGFDMRVLHTRRTPSGDPAWRDLDALLVEADVVTLHTPLTPETTGLVSRERLALLRDGATLVNTARGAVVDEAALVDELVSGRISAGLDVFVHEPYVPEALRGLPNVVLTPHIASATAETRGAMTRLVVDNVLAFLRGEPLPTQVV
jgi:glyoxylate reductase